jgi:hypothetical protein
MFLENQYTPRYGGGSSAFENRLPTIPKRDEERSTRYTGAFQRTEAAAAYCDSLHYKAVSVTETESRWRDETPNWKSEAMQRQ